MPIYRIIKTGRGPGDVVWTLVHQESEDSMDIAVIRAYSDKHSAEAAKAWLERQDAETAQ